MPGDEHKHTFWWDGAEGHCPCGHTITSAFTELEQKAVHWEEEARRSAQNTTYWREHAQEAEIRAAYWASTYSVVVERLLGLLKRWFALTRHQADWPAGTFDLTEETRAELSKFAPKEASDAC